MRRWMLALLPTFVLTAGPVRAGTAEVSYEQPDRYADAGTGRDADTVRRTLTGHLQTLAAARLPASQLLRVTVTDIDLAGRIPPGAAQLHEVRVLGRPVDWPRISLRYTLHDGERLLADGSETVADMGYASRSGILDSRTELPHERRMLDDWFRDRFGRFAAAH